MLRLTNTSAGLYFDLGLILVFHMTNTSCRLDSVIIYDGWKQRTKRPLRISNIRHI